MAGENMMNVTFYNGFAPSCNLSGFFVTGGNLKDQFPIAFNVDGVMNSELAILGPIL